MAIKIEDLKFNLNPIINEFNSLPISIFSESQPTV